MPAPRRHRLPQRLDWSLIPPPLDLSQPLVDEKALLPAIIVTPSSPTCDRDFAIAFLADKEAANSSRGLGAELATSSPTRAFLRTALKRAATPPHPFRPRTLLLVGVVLFLLLCHAFAHCVAARRPRLHFVQSSSALAAAEGESKGWFDLNDYRRPRAADFVVAESESDKARRGLRA